MHKDEHTFTLRFSLRAEIPDVLLDDDDFDESEWLREWESRVKPGLVREIFRHLRSVEGWRCHARNRGMSASDEIEIVVEKEFVPPAASS